MCMAVFSLHVEVIFSVYCEKYFWTAPPLIFFAGTPIIVITFFFTSQIFIFLPDRGGFNFLGNLFFLFLRGGGVKRGWSTFEHI